MKINTRLMRKLTVLIMAMLLITTFPGCTKSKLSVQEKSTVIKVIVKKKDASFFSVVKMGAEAAGKEFNVKVEFDGPNDEMDINGQIRLVNKAIDQKADAIVLAASDYVKLASVAERAVSEKIPVIVIDSEIKSEKMKCFIGTDNLEAGKMLGESLINKVGDKCNIAVINFVKGAASADMREEGFKEAIGKYRGVKVLSIDYCNSDEYIAKQLMERYIKEYPGLNAVVCLNANCTIGAARVIDRLNIAGRIKIIGFDSTPDEIDFMEYGIIQSLIVQKPFSMGYLGVKYALDAIMKKSLPKRINTGSKIVDTDNMYEPENQKLLFPFTN